MLRLENFPLTLLLLLLVDLSEIFLLVLSYKKGTKLKVITSKNQENIWITKCMIQMYNTISYQNTNGILNKTVQQIVNLSECVLVSKCKH